MQFCIVKECLVLTFISLDDVKVSLKLFRDYHLVVKMGKSLNCCTVVLNMASLAPTELQVCVAVKWSALSPSLYSL